VADRVGALGVGGVGPKHRRQLARVLQPRCRANWPRGALPGSSGGPSGAARGSEGGYRFGGVAGGGLDSSQSANKCQESGGRFTVVGPR
jgi:hypothetical protein